MKTSTKIAPDDGVEATVGVVDGRLAMTAGGDVELYLTVEDPPPLSEKERAASIRVQGDDFRAEIELETQAIEDLEETIVERDELLER